MYIRNSIIDKLEKDADDFSYALNIGLKSGESVYVDGISKGEKNGYVNFAKHSTETMILEIDNSLWRIQAEDIESINVKQYQTNIDNSFRWFNNLFFSGSKFKRTTYFMWIKWFIFGVIISFIYAGINIVLQGDIMTALMDPSSSITLVFDSVGTYIGKIFLMIFIIMIITFIIDCILPSDEPYKKIKPFTEYASTPRIYNLVLILLFLLFYKIIATLVSGLI